MISLPSPRDAGFVSLLADSHLRLTGNPMLPDSAAKAGDIAEWLYEKAPFGLLAHDNSADPCFIYANRAAQSFFEYGWDEFIGMPSRLSAPPVNQISRAELMKGILTRGYSEGYRGLREAKSGRQFWIENVTIWNLVDGDGELHGQAALIRDTTPA